MGGAGRVRYRHLRRTVIAVLATIAFLLIFALAARAVLEAEPTRRLARSWLVGTAAGYGAELEIGDLHWGLLPPGLRLSRVKFKGAGVEAEIDSLQVDLGRVWLTQRAVELGRVGAKGVRLSLTGLPRSSGKSQGQIKVRVRQFSLEDLEFEGVDLPGKTALDLEGVRSSWSTEDRESRGFAEVARARLEIGRMEPVTFSLLMTTESISPITVSKATVSSSRDTAESATVARASRSAGLSISAGSTVSSRRTACSTARLKWWP